MCSKSESEVISEVEVDEESAAAEEVVEEEGRGGRLGLGLLLWAWVANRRFGLSWSWIGFVLGLGSGMWLEAGIGMLD